MGGMAAQIPIKNDPEQSQAALDKVRADKLREVLDRHDGTWVAHPGLVPIAREVFEAHASGPNQLDRLRDDVRVTAADLLRVPLGTRSEEGLRLNVRVGIQYLEAWLKGSGCVPLYHLMEDAATAEISRTQLWQWIRHGATLDDGRGVDADLYRRIRDEEMASIGARPHLATAARTFDELILASELADFLTIPAYEALLDVDLLKEPS